MFFHAWEVLGKVIHLSLGMSSGKGSSVCAKQCAVREAVTERMYEKDDYIFRLGYSILLGRKNLCIVFYRIRTVQCSSQTLHLQVSGPLT